MTASESGKKILKSCHKLMQVRSRYFDVHTRENPARKYAP